MDEHTHAGKMHWAKFFLPAYAFFISISLACYLGYIEIFELAYTAVSGIVTIAIAVLSQELFPKTFPYIGRSVYHSLGGIMIVLVGVFLMDSVTLSVFLACILSIFATGVVTDRLGLETVFSKRHVSKHVEGFSKSSHYTAGFYWLFSCIVLLLMFTPAIAFASILVLAVGDTAASFLGRRIGKTRNPLNHKKSVEGSVAFFATSLFVLMIFFQTGMAILVAFLAALAEALPLKVNDNLTVPLLTGAILFLVTHFV